LCLKEFERLSFALKEATFLRGSESCEELVRSYFIDAKHFLDNEKYLECFELSVYVFGILDCLARLGLLDPGKARKHYKI